MKEVSEFVLMIPWFKRGTKLLFVGYRRDNDFYCNSNNSPYEHSVMKINGVSNGEVIMQTQKKNNLIKKFK